MLWFRVNDVLQCARVAFYQEMLVNDKELVAGLLIVSIAVFRSPPGITELCTGVKLIGNIS